jgi:hypothetical protein
MAEMKSQAVSYLVFVSKFLLFFLGLYLFVSGVMDLLHARFLYGIISLVAGAASIRLGAFLFSLRI